MSKSRLPIQTNGKISKRDFRSILLLLWLTLMLFGLSACGSSSNSFSSASTTSSAVSGGSISSSETSINFGETIPRSSPSFTSVSAGIKAYFSEINSTGGVNGHKLRLNIALNQGTGQSSAAAKRLVFQNKIFALLGSGPATSLISQLPIYQQTNTPIVGPITGSASIHDVLRSFVFSIGPSYQTEGQKIADFIARSKGAGSVAIMYQNNSFGSELLSGYQLAEHSFPILVPFRPTDTDFSSQASMLQSEGVKTVVIFADNITVGNILDSFDSIGFNPNVVISQASYNANLFSTIGSGVSNIYVSGFIPSMASSDANADMQQYKTAMAKYEPGSSVDQYSAWGWLDAEVTVDALKNLKNTTLTTTSFINALDSLRGIGTLAGVVSYMASSRNALNSAHLYKLVNGHRIRVSTLQ